MVNTSIKIICNECDQLIDEDNISEHFINFHKQKTAELLFNNYLSSLKSEIEDSVSLLIDEVEICDFCEENIVNCTCEYCEYCDKSLDVCECKFCSICEELKENCTCEQ